MEGHSTEIMCSKLEPRVGEAVERISYSEVRRGSLHIIGDFTLHVHLLVTPRDREGLSRIMRYLGRRYVPYVNHEYGRTGTLWERRFKSSLAQDRSYLLASYRFGNDRFHVQIEQALGRAVGFSRRGRPQKPIGADSKKRVRSAKQLPHEGVGGNDQL
jgi:hypothetical protein